MTTDYGRRVAELRKLTVAELKAAIEEKLGTPIPGPKNRPKDAWVMSLALFDDYDVDGMLKNK